MAGGVKRKTAFPHPADGQPRQRRRDDARAVDDRGIKGDGVMAILGGLGTASSTCRAESRAVNHAQHERQREDLPGLDAAATRECRKQRRLEHGQGLHHGPACGG